MLRLLQGKVDFVSAVRGAFETFWGEWYLKECLAELQTNMEPGATRDEDRPEGFRPTSSILPSDPVKQTSKATRGIPHELLQPLGATHRRHHGHDRRRQFSVFLD